MKLRIFGTLFFLLALGEANGNHLYLYFVSPPDGELRQVFLNALKRDGIEFSLCMGSKNLEEHLIKVGEINSKSKGVFLALEMKRAKKRGMFVATFKPKKAEGKILRIDEIPYVHLHSSMKLAHYVASSYGKKVVRLPLFPLLGVDMPALYLRLQGGKEDMEFAATVIAEGIKKSGIWE